MAREGVWVCSRERVRDANTALGAMILPPSDLVHCNERGYLQNGVNVIKSGSICTNISIWLFFLLLFKFVLVSEMVNL